MEERTRWDGIARSIIMEENREVNTCEEASSIQLVATTTDSGNRASPVRKVRKRVSRCCRRGLMNVWT